MKALTLLATIMFIAIGFAHAGELKDKDAAKQLAQTVMGYVEKGDMENGIKQMKPYLIIPDHEFEGMLNSFRMQAPVIEQRFGKTLGTEFVTAEETGDSLMLIMYIQKFEKHLMRWKFYFYKPQNGWVLNTFNTDDQIQQMFKTK